MSRETYSEIYSRLETALCMAAIDQRSLRRRFSFRFGSAPEGGNAAAAAEVVLPIIREAQKAGATTLRDIAAALNARGVATARGGQWQAKSISNILERA